MVSLTVFPRFWIAALALFVVASSVSRAETRWLFGSGPGRDGAGGFVRGNTSSTNGKWTVEENALRFTNRFAGGGSDHNNYTEAAAVIDLREQGHRPGRDFTISVLMEARGISDWNRFGLLALAPDMREHAYQDDGFYGALFIFAICRFPASAPIRMNGLSRICSTTATW